MPKSKSASTRGRKKAARPAAPAPPASRKGGNDLPRLFDQAIGLATSGFFLDAIKKFDQVVKADPKSALADDAIYNAGLCTFRLGLFEDAISYFTRVIQGYPKATIHAAAGAQEFGRTAAKALLGRLHCQLALGRRPQAQKELDELNKYPDSYVLDGAGQKHTYYDLGLAALK